MHQYAQPGQPPPDGSFPTDPSGLPEATRPALLELAGLQAAGVRFRPRVAGAHGRTVRLADGTSLDAGVVVWATGYRSDYSWIDIPGVIGDGKVIHRRGVTAVSGLYFLGLSWQHTRGSALLGFVRGDAAHLAGHITVKAGAPQATAQPAPQRTP